MRHRRALVASTLVLGVTALGLPGALAGRNATINYSLTLTKTSATKKQLKLTNRGSTKIASLGFKGTDFTITKFVAHPVKGSCLLAKGVLECTKLDLGDKATLIIDIDVTGAGGAGLYQVGAGALVLFPAVGNPLAEQALVGPGGAPQEQKLKIGSAAERRGDTLTYVIHNDDSVPILFFRLETPGLKVNSVGKASETGGGKLTCTSQPAYVECTGGLSAKETAEVPLKVAGSGTSIVEHVHTSVHNGVEKSVSDPVLIDLVGDADLEVSFLPAKKGLSTVEAVNNGPAGGVFQLHLARNPPSGAVVHGDGFTSSNSWVSDPLYFKPHQKRFWAVVGDSGEFKLSVDAEAFPLAPTVDPNRKNNSGHDYK